MYKTQLSSQSVQLINILLNDFLAAEEWMQKKKQKIWIYEKKHDNVPWNVWFFLL